MVNYTMKRNSFFLLLLSSLFIGQVAGEVDLDDDVLSAVMNIKGMKAAYEKCKVEMSSLPANGSKTMSDCLNEQFPSIEDKEKIQKAIISATEDKKKKEKKSIYSIEKASLDLIPDERKDKEKTEAYKKLNEYFEKKFSEVMFGNPGQLEEESKNLYEIIRAKGNLVDEKTFQDLFQANVSKSIIHSISSFCMDTQIVEGNLQRIYIAGKEGDKKLEAARKDNIKNLVGPGGKNGGDVSADRWSTCALNVSNYCYGEKIDSGPIKIDPKDDGYCGTDKDCKDQFAETKRRSCEVVSYLKKSRQELMASGKIIEKLGEYEKNLGGIDTRFYNAAEKGKSVDDLTDITSGELAKKEGLLGFSEVKVEEHQLLEKCTKAQNVNDEDCQKLIKDRAIDYDQEALSLYQRKEALAKKIDESSHDELEQVLIDQGLSAAEAKVRLDTQEKYDLLRAKLKKRHEEQFQQLVDQYGGVSNPSKKLTKEQQDLEKLQKIQQELGSGPDRLAQLLHYSNIVSGLLDVSASDEKGDNIVKMKNTAILQKELKNSVYSTENFEAFQKANEGSPQSDSSGLDTTIIYDQVGEFDRRGKEIGEKLKDEGNPSVDASSKLIDAKLIGTELLDDFDKEKK